MKSKSLPNPLNVKNIQMAQMVKPKAAAAKQLNNFSLETDGGCTPVLEMTEGYKIDLVAANANKCKF